MMTLMLALCLQDVDALIRALDHDQPEERNRAAAALVAMGDAVLPRMETLAAAPPSAEVGAQARRIVRDILLSPEIREMIKAVTTGAWSWYGPPERPVLREEVQVGLAREIRGSAEVKKAYAALADGKNWQGQKPAVQTLKNAKAVYCLTSGLLVSSYLSQLDCGDALADLKDLRAVPTMIEMAAALAIPVEGSKQATVHGFRQHGIAKALDRLLDTSAGWKDRTQNPEALRKGQAVWQAALERARTAGK